MLTVTDPNGGVVSAEYDKNGNIVKVTDAEKNVTTFAYDALNRLSSYTDAEGHTSSYTYDGNGNILTYTDGNGNVTKYTYDGLDRAVSRTNAEGNVASNTYDAEGRMVKAVDEEGAVTLYAYDDCGRLTSMTDALGHVTAFEYDVMDRVTKVTDARGNSTTYTYDALGNVVSQTNAKGVTTTYTYDANRNLTSVKDAAGATAYTLDALGRVTKVTDKNGNAQSFTYDAGGRITKVTDKNGNETAYTYDGNGNIVKTTDALGNESVFAYNANDQLVSMDLHRVDGVNGADEHQVTLYEYDGRNLVTKEINAAGGNTLYVYDGNGNMISKTDGDGYVTEYTYNSLDLVSHISYNGTKEVTYQYNKVSELVKMDDWLGTTTFELDLLNQLKKVTDHKGNVVEYTYDEVGNQTNLTYPDKSTVTNSYDALGQLTQMTDGDGGKYTYTYDDAGNVTKLTYPNGWVEEYSYDAEGNLLKTVDTDPFHNNKKSTKYEYTYDAEGNLVSEYKRDTTAANRALTTTYGYDALNRLVSAHEEGVGVNTSRTYQYDTLGNLIREEQDGCIEYKYNGAHLDESTKCGTIPNSIGTAYWDYTYDGRGNLVSKDKYTRTTTGMDWQNEETYVYDETNRLVQGKNENGEVSLYTYNGLGVRVGRELIMKDNTHGYTDFHDRTPSVDTGIDKPEVAVESYVVDYTTATRETLTMHEEGGFDYRWVYGLDKLSVKITSEGTNWWGQNVKQDILKDYLHQDRLGSTTNLTDKFGRVVGRADYNEWGEITYKDALDITSSYRRIWPQSSYTGHDWDDVLGMYYAKARFYDPDAKRFVAMDPVKGKVTEPLSLVPYVYCVDNPLRWVDQLGLNPEDYYESEKYNLSRTSLQKGVEQAATDFAPYSYNVSSLSSVATRELDMERGIVAALLINAGESAGRLLQLLKDLGTLTHILPSDNDFNFYTQTSQNLRDIETYLYLPQVTFKDSYYAGKALGDLISAAAGIKLAIEGLAKMVKGAGGITAGILESSTGAGAAVGIPTVVANVAIALDGVAVGATGLDISARALGNFGDDLGKFDYYKKLACQEFTERWNELMKKTVKRTENIPSKSSTQIYDRIGVSDVETGKLVAQDDFLDLEFDEIKIDSRGNHETYIGTAPNGERYNLHFSSDEQCWCIQHGRIKIRYGSGKSEIQ